ncbi:DDB1- and CUL4-associated factor 8 [Morella rubra]|uniref:DDB1-and CUL4-associated factor 8 n=1 Tax=Morella rubra TaxID=262757 RepID=A0A6A1WLT6_9ROSI|nr:DDB1- and CUL4-associated factor 8 [Morella rubra]
MEFYFLFLTHEAVCSRLIRKINLYGHLNGHEGGVFALQFNSTGDLLVSGSADKQVILWNWANKTKCLSYPSGHSRSVFQTRIMPFTDDRRIVTSSRDGQVRLGQVWEDGRVDTKRLGRHLGVVIKLAVEPGSPHILYSCGEDGFVQHFDLRSSSATKIFRCYSLKENRKQPPKSIRLNDIVFDQRNPNYVAVGGADEYARVYDLRKCQLGASSNADRLLTTFCPHHLIGNNNVHITGLAYSNTSNLLVSYNNELIYLFQRSMELGPLPPISAPQEPHVYLGHRNCLTVKGVNFFGPNDDYILSGSDCGHIFVWKKEENDIKLWAPMASDAPPLPENLEEILESNKEVREDHSRLTLTLDAIMHIRRLQRQQRYSRADIESDDE